MSGDPDKALAALQQAHERVVVAAKAVGENPTDDGESERVLLEAMAERRTAAATLGMTLLRWGISGGIVRFQETATEPDELDVGALLEVTEVIDETAVVVAPLESPPASQAQLKKLTEWDGSAEAARERDQAREIQQELEVLEALLDDFGKPRRIRTQEEFRTELALLERATEADKVWVYQPQERQKALVGLCAARARHLQDEAAPKLDHPFVGSALDNVFSALTAYSGQYRPGFVLGLMRTHSPESSTWIEDAQNWWDDLCSVLEPSGKGTAEGDVVEELPPDPNRTLNILAGICGEDEVRRQDVVDAALLCLDAFLSADDPRLVKTLLPHVRLLSKEPRLKAIRKAIREYKKSLTADNRKAENDKALLPEDWPYWFATRGKNAVIVGGDSRPKVVARFKGIFDFAEITWESGHQTRCLESLVSRIESGKLHMVIFLARFSSHSAQNALFPACKKAGIPYLLIPRGYGASLVQSEIERTVTVPTEDDE
jgi:hypothetical protein